MSFFKNLNRPKSVFEEHGQQLTEYLCDELLKRKDDGAGNLHLRTYQIEAVIATRKYFETQRGSGSGIEQYPPALIQMPTGSGKSGVVVMLPYVLQCKKVLILTPSKTITNQLADAFGYSGLVPGFFETNIMLPNENRTDLINSLEKVTLINSSIEVQRNVQIGNLCIVNAQKFGGRSNASLFHQNKVIVKNARKFFEQFCTIIVDEAHYWPAPTWKAIVDNFKGPGKHIVFLTATPERKGISILPPENTVYRVPRSEIEGKYIRRCEFTEYNKKVPEGNFTNDPNFCHQLRRKIEIHLHEHDKKEPTVVHQAMVLVRLTDEATTLAQNLNKCNGKAGDDKFATDVISGSRSQKKIREFTSGAFRVAITCGMLLEGYDNKNVSVCFILRNIHPKSKVLFCQFVGRCLRMSHLPNKLDSVTAQVVSFKKYKQKLLWDQMEEIAEEDPEDPDDI